MDDRVKTVIDDILDQCDIIEGLMKRFGNDIEDFVSDDAYNMSCTFALMQIGENVKKIDSVLIENCDGIDWDAICRFRDLVAHNYGKVSKKVVWNILEEDFPQMHRSLSSYRNKLD